VKEELNDKMMADKAEALQKKIDEEKKAMELAENAKKELER